MILFAYFIGTIVGSFFGVLLAFAVLDIQESNRNNGRRR